MILRLMSCFEPVEIPHLLFALESLEFGEWAIAGRAGRAVLLSDCDNDRPGIAFEDGLKCFVILRKWNGLTQIEAKRDALVGSEEAVGAVAEAFADEPGGLARVGAHESWQDPHRRQGRKHNRGDQRCDREVPVIP